MHPDVFWFYTEKTGILNKLPDTQKAFMTELFNWILYLMKKNQDKEEALWCQQLCGLLLLFQWAGAFPDGEWQNKLFLFAESNLHKLVFKLEKTMAEKESSF